MEHLRFILIFMLISVGCKQKSCLDTLDTGGQKTVIKFKLPEHTELRDLKIQVAKADYVIQPEFSVRRPKIVGQYAVWELSTDDLLFLNLMNSFGSKYIYCLLEPGDSIVIEKRSGIPNATGNGAAKIQIMNEIYQTLDSVEQARNRDFSKTISLEDFNQYSQFIDVAQDSLSSVFGRYKSSISGAMLMKIEQRFRSELEYRRLMKFGRLLNRKDKLQIPLSSLEEACDKALFAKYVTWLHLYRDTPMNLYYYYDYVRRTIERKHHFNFEGDSLRGVSRKIEYAEKAKQLYKEELLESYLTLLITEEGLKEHVLKDGEVPEISALLAEFYNRPGYNNYKAYVRSYESKIQDWIRAKQKIKNS